MIDAIHRARHVLQRTGFAEPPPSVVAAARRPPAELLAGRLSEERPIAPPCGTDHGTAAPHFVAGGRVAGGLHGRSTDLSRLERGDPAFTTDFRALYATVARDWFGRTLAEAPFAGFGTLPLIARA